MDAAVVGSVWDQAAAAFRDGSWARALALYEEGEEPTTRQDVLRMVRVHAAMEDHIGALELASEQLERDRVQAGEASQDYAMTSLELADVMQELGDHARALELTELADKILQGTPLQGHCFYHLGGIAYDRDQYQQALEHYTRAADLLLHDEIALALVLNGISLCHFELGHVAEALAVRLKELDVTARVHGKEHPEYATSLESLADIYAKCGGFASALELLETCAVIRRVKLGDEHGATEDALDEIEEMRALVLKPAHESTLRMCHACNRIGAADTFLGCKLCGVRFHCSERCLADDNAAHTLECARTRQMREQEAKRKAELAAKKKAKEEKKKARAQGGKKGGGAAKAKARKSKK